MKKLLLFLMLSVAITGCRKDSRTQSTDAALKGTWKSTLIIDVVYDSKTREELTRFNYLHGLGTLITFDGKGSTTSKDTILNISLTNAYTLRTENNNKYLTTRIVNINKDVEYQILGLYDTQLQLKGTIRTNFDFLRNDGKYYNVYYERTEHYTRQ
ncbi:hypothetical protein [Mucilaginibacter sp.]|jgi:hypothetical protein|uniref:hypothetical protein n=1 Tax=Mucilaginibacter sp. TaxID=1882438 RepID=UPI003564BAD0